MAELMKVDYVTHDESYFENTIHSKLRRVALALSGAVVGIHSDRDTGLWEDGTEVDWGAYESNGWNCMVQIPKFYYKVENGTLGMFKDVYRCEISEIQRDGFKLHPAFERIDGVIENYQYVAAFEGWVDGNGRLRSLPNKTITIGRTRANFRAAAQLNGLDFRQIDYLLLSAIQMLFITEYASFNSQKTLGKGMSLTANNFLGTGKSLKNGNRSYGDKETNSAHMTYRGLENLWGNYYSYVDGVNFYHYVTYISRRIFEDNKTSGNYEYTGIKLINSNGYIKNFKRVDGYYDFNFLPVEVGAAESSYLGDYHLYTSGHCGLAFGGATPTQGQTGLFQTNIQIGSTSILTNCGSRLAYILS
ncbi:hypothetical protein [Lysinibacillus fusiformis]|uniref:hypothetical protein n=1 Tax=Lysinibacillus fusiformis TaxID=28031 RepID=UPI00046896A7|nr:hypothetical protein [Lysinibacillus fusiformis]